MTTQRRAYWSERTGKRPKDAALSGEVFRELFSSLASDLEEAGLFQEAFGLDCVDAGWTPGTLGTRVNDRLMLLLGHKDSWPITGPHPQDLKQWDDDRVFDMIEFLYDHVSAGLEDDPAADFHTWGECGWHFRNFDKASGQAKFRGRINELLSRYNGGYELDQHGQIVRKAPDGLDPLLSARLPDLPAGDADHVANAITKFRARSATRTDRRDAVRDLADVLERIRPDVKEHMLSKDEAALFVIANQFWIRHNKPTEKREYDHEAWWSWLFYLYLDSIALVTHLREAQQEAEAGPPTTDEVIRRGRELRSRRREDATAEPPINKRQ